VPFVSRGAGTGLSGGALPAAGRAPPLRPVPAPLLTNGTRCFAQKRTAACTSSVLRGSTTASGSTLKLVSPSHSYVCSWLRPVMIRSGPSVARNSSSCLSFSTVQTSLRDLSRKYLPIARVSQSSFRISRKECWLQIHLSDLPRSSRHTPCASASINCALNFNVPGSP